jgi:hypothetical protein
LSVININTRKCGFCDRVFVLNEPTNLFVLQTLVPPSPHPQSPSFLSQQSATYVSPVTLSPPTSGESERGKERIMNIGHLGKF